MFGFAFKGPLLLQSGLLVVRLAFVAVALYFAIMSLSTKTAHKHKLKRGNKAA
jgi:hypothetical protein